MSIASRAVHIDTDLPLITDLAWVASPMTPHRVDLPWRLTSPSLDDPRNARLWFGGDGVLLAFAAWQVYWAALDLFLCPGPWQREVEDAVFTWACGRFRDLDAERGLPLPYWAEARADDSERLKMLARHGFTVGDDISSLLMERSLTDALPAPALPKEFTIRQLAGAAEVDAYAVLHRATFESTAITGAWRQRTLSAPHYLRDLDLVAVAPDGTLAGFCVCWLAPDRTCGQIEPAGVHPDFRRLGLARALQHEAFRRLRAHGATAALVEPLAGDTPATRAYADVGFRPIHAIIRKGRLM